jgi:CrcB protein
MVNIIVLVFVGGAFGAMLREFIMQIVPHLAYNFPTDILVANLAADFLLGLATALHRRQILSDDGYMMVGTGIMGGWSTFSSFAYGSFSLISASKASAVVGLVYVVISLVLGYIAVIVGGKVGAIKTQIASEF